MIGVQVARSELLYSAGAVANGLAVELDQGLDAGDGAAQQGLAPAGAVDQAGGALDDPEPLLGGEAEQDGAGDPGEDAAVEGTGLEHLAATHEEIGAAALAELAGLADEEHLVHLPVAGLELAEDGGE